tara:strand:- start:297 stop:569 length:273 start_codon:yes stop_codon:yes gene_type:complete
MKSQKELFKHVWETREHVSEVSGKSLLPRSHYQWHWQFAHILSKGAYPAFKLNPNNIMLMLPEEHEKQEQYDLFNERKEALKRQYYENKN